MIWMAISIHETEKETGEKAENAGYKTFSIFSNIFKALFLRVMKLGIVFWTGNPLPQDKILDLSKIKAINRPSPNYINPL